VGAAVSLPGGAPAGAKAPGSAAHDRPAVGEAGDVEVQARQLRQTLPGPLLVFVKHAEAQTGHVGGGVADEQHAAAHVGQKRDVPDGVAGGVDDTDTPGHRQHVAVLDQVTNGDRNDRPLGAHAQPYDRVGARR
jgi:hypothetical protein